MNKAIIFIITVAVMAGAFFLLGPNENTGFKTHEAVLVFERGTLMSGPSVLQVKKGDMVEVTIAADTEEEFHLHGYDRSIDIGPGNEALLRFTADMSGRFIAELEVSKAEVWVLEVMP